MCGVCDLVPHGGGGGCKCDLIPHGGGGGCKCDLVPHGEGVNVTWFHMVRG